MLVGSADIIELFSTIVVIGILDLTAVSKSSPTIPKAASPMKLTQNLSGLASFAPMTRPSPVPSACDLPAPQVRPGHRGDVERRHLVSRTTRVVGDDRLGWVYRSHEIPDDAVRRYGNLIRGELRHPFAHPGIPHLLEFCATDPSSSRLPFSPSAALTPSGSAGVSASHHPGWDSPQ